MCNPTVGQTSQYDDPWILHRAYPKPGIRNESKTALGANWLTAPGPFWQGCAKTRSGAKSSERQRGKKGAVAKVLSGPPRGLSPRGGSLQHTIRLLLSVRAVPAALTGTFATSGISLQKAASVTPLHSKAYKPCKVRSLGQWPPPWIWESSKHKATDMNHDGIWPLCW